jgi:omega-6 fatty acid desaturase (delta-12 desaturase)
LQAAVLPVTPPLFDDEGKMKQMAEDYGFTQIGDELPDNITLKDVMDTLPKEVPTVNTSLLLVF